MVVFPGGWRRSQPFRPFLKSAVLGIINGSSGQRNQDTIKRFRKNPPECHVIVSTEAGSEGVNLQVANVLVNYDLPWNPMIVEQRRGAGDHRVSSGNHFISLRSYLKPLALLRASLFEFMTRYHLLLFLSVI
jgi:hypothetical protein